MCNEVRFLLRIVWNNCLTSTPDSWVFKTGNQSVVTFPRVLYVTGRGDPQRLTKEVKPHSRRRVGPVQQVFPLLVVRLASFCGELVYRTTVVIDLDE